jgi:hypothetical protein
MTSTLAKQSYLRHLLAIFSPLIVYNCRVIYPPPPLHPPAQLIIIEYCSNEKKHIACVRLPLLKRQATHCLCPATVQTKKNNIAHLCSAVTEVRLIKNENNIAHLCLLLF